MMADFLKARKYCKGRSMCYILISKVSISMDRITPKSIMKHILRYKEVCGLKLNDCYCHSYQALAGKEASGGMNKCKINSDPARNVRAVPSGKWKEKSVRVLHNRLAGANGSF